MKWTVEKEIKFFEYNSCIRKNKYKSLKEALINVLKRRENGSDINSIYKCLFCNHYHVGNIRKKTRYRRKRIAKLIGVVK